jgi:membrane protein
MHMTEQNGNNGENGEERASGEHKTPGRWMDAIKRFLHFCKLVYVQWAGDNCPQKSGALAFVSVLSLVPLTAVGIALLEATGHTKGEDALVNFLSKQVVPLQGQNIIGYIRDFAANIKVRALGAVGVGLTLTLSYFVFHSVEETFNDIWRTRERRPLLRKFTVFWALATLGPFVLALSILQGAQIFRGFTPVWVLVPFLGTWLLLTLANRLLPYTRVNWKSAMVAGLVSAIVFEGAKYGFSIYFTKVAFTNYTTIYGKLALIPTLLVWIGVSWTAVLIGVETGYVLQNKGLVEVRHRDQAFANPETGWTRWVNGSIASRVMLALSVWYAAGRGAIQPRELATALNLPEEAVAEILRRFREAQIIVQVHGDVEGYMPNRMLGDITLHEILGMFEDVDVDAPDQEELDEAFKRIEQAHQDILGGIDFAHLAHEQLKAEPSPANSNVLRKIGQRIKSRTQPPEVSEKPPTEQQEAPSGKDGEQTSGKPSSEPPGEGEPDDEGPSGPQNH